MNVKEIVSGFVLDKAMNYISGDPETNLPKLLGWVDALGIKSFESQSKAIHEVLDDPDNIWYKFIMNIWRDVDNDVLKSVFQNFALIMLDDLDSQILRQAVIDQTLSLAEMLFNLDKFRLQNVRISHGLGFVEYIQLLNPVI